MAKTDDGDCVLDYPADGVARLRMNRAEEVNCLSLEMIGALDAQLDRLREAPPRALILTGSAKAFCGGADIRAFASESSRLRNDARAVRAYVADILQVFGRLRDAPFPTIAAINGHALGGGLELALHCDLRIAATDASIGLPEVRVGAFPGGGGVQFLASIVGLGRAAEIILLAEPMRGAEALAAGIVSAVHEPEALADAAIALARRFLDKSPAAIAHAKRSLYRCRNLGSAESNALALDAVEIAAADPQWWEGMSAFAEKRAPSFRMD